MFAKGGKRDVLWLMMMMAEASLSPPEQTSICQRCKMSFSKVSNTSSSCRFHPAFFVSRRHDDQKRYYELGPNDPPYAAKFYDCCGAEDPKAQGCRTSYHVSYDDT